jgi:asparagine synthase (glutamine-hydrolysing)
MIDAETGSMLVFNGEIYGFASLRRELERDGARFETAGDTEVVLRLLVREGHAALPRLHGMFALAFWDARDGSVLLARDRFGEKPLFHTTLGDGTLVAASEPAALADACALPRDPSPRGLGQFLALGYTLGTDTLWRGVRSLRPGTALIFDRSLAPRELRFARPVEGSHDPGLTGAAAESAVEAALARVVRDELVADVPLGVFLSGGVDSSLIAAFALAERRGGELHAFGLGFDDPEFDETLQAAAFAKSKGIAFHRQQLVLGGDDFAAAFEAAAREPIADTSFLPMWLLARFARGHVTVALSGDGGDELFGGYETYVADHLRARWGWIPGPALSAMKALVRVLVPVRHGKVGIDYKIRQFLDGLRLDAPGAHHHWRRLFARGALGPLLRGDALEWCLQHDGLDEFERAWHECPDDDLLARAMYTDLSTWLPNDILVKVDRATMAHSLESRAPFLHPELAATAWRVARRERTDGKRTKQVLRRLAARIAGTDVAARPKRGFNAPVSRWFAGDGRGFVEERLRTRRMRELFAESTLSELVGQHGERVEDHGFRLLALCVLAHWLEGSR